MAKKAAATKQDLIERVAQIARDRNKGSLGDDGAAGGMIAETFLRQYYNTVPADDMDGRDPDLLYGITASLLAFARQRVAGVPKIRIYTPRIEEHGWQSDHTVIEIVNDDMSFLVDSVTAALAAQDAPVLMLVHPVIHVRRLPNGELSELLDADIDLSRDGMPQGVTSESVMHIEITEISDLLRQQAIQRDLEQVLAENRAVVEDWGKIRATLQDSFAGITSAPVDRIKDADEVCEFLPWLLENHFTFLGYRSHTFDHQSTPEGSADLWTVGVSDGLGILRDPNQLVFDELRNLSGLPSDVISFLNQPTFLLITKSNRRARVHRAVHMDVIGIKQFDADGQVIGLHMLVGLFTSNVYTNSASFVPILRRKVERVLARTGFRPSGHDGKAILNILENLPRDELFQASEDKLLDMALTILHLQERQKAAVLVRQDEFERFVSCLVYVPRDRYDTALRLAIKDILEAVFHGELDAYYTQVADSPLARLHFIIRTQPGHLPTYDIPSIEARIALAARAWSDHLADAILAAKGEEQGMRLIRRYADGFPSFYKEQTSAQGAVFDIDRIEEAIALKDAGQSCNPLTMNLYRPLEAAENAVHFKVYHPGSAVPLSEILPMLESMGFNVVGEIPFEVTLKDDRGRLAQTAWLHDFDMRAADVDHVDVAAIRSAFHEAFARVWSGDAENDGFNRLVVAAGLAWREVVILRAYAKYLRQATFTFSQASIEAALAAHPDIARTLIRLFHARFDPHGAGGDPAIFTQRILAALENVSSPDEDRILRRYLNLIQSTLRTNYYQKGSDGQPKPYVSFKIDSRQVEGLPLPRPMVEVWVYSPRVEAIHLRGGKVARGGIRWSDRREDFRTEILGLIKAQMVKNAVIVPVGSKGGFVVKRPPTEGGRDAFLAEGIECYKTLMRGLLDLTDNLVSGAVVPPVDVVRLDEDDPYLVVAADKGTATFSDIANGISLEYGFWLGDAFASGGSQGYDHKAMGITARGGWEAVKRHFREMGRNTQAEDFTVIGIGDMSGDVFGNGMMLSPHIRLVGAFNHMHIFVDPNPSNPAQTLVERQRLFALPRSSWADYDRSLISEGGGIFERSAKKIPLSPQIKALFGLSVDEISPADLIQAMLTAQVDLLWFGGIGTYIKASSEADSQVGDRANDAVRVNGRDVRAKVIGEGANLGVTQRGRIEYARLGGPTRQGGRINTDAIDNSAGVDCSDHEVNIKILLNGIVAEGDMTLKQRNALLVEMTEEVGVQVLRDNYLQTQAITMMQSQGVDLLDHQARLMRMLEKSGRLNRTVEFLPDDEELANRQKAKQGLTRPELAVLIAYSKMWLFDEIVQSDLPDDPMMVEDLVSYFPSPLQQRFREQIGSHKLRREIIATHATNSMINRVGGTFVTQIIEKTGMPAADIARAYLVARDAFGLRDVWHGIEALDTITPAVMQQEMLHETTRLLERATLWVLRHAARPIDMGRLISDIGEGRVALRSCLHEVCPSDLAAAIEARETRYGYAKVPPRLAGQVAEMIVLASTPDVVRLAQELEIPISTAARYFFLVGSRFLLGWLRGCAEGVANHGSHWDKLAVAAVIDELYIDQRAITAAVLRQANGSYGDALAVIERWADSCRPAVERAEQLISELRAAASVDLAMLTVASRQFGALKGH